MEIERVTELPMHQRPRKRQRLGWDVAPQQPEAQLGLFCGHEVGNLTSYAPSRMLSYHHSYLFVKDMARNVSPHLRADDEDGHYVFELGENLTSQKIQSKMGEGTFDQVLECWDKEKKEMVVIKVIRGIKKYCDAAMIEIDMLQQLCRHDKGAERYA